MPGAVSVEGAVLFIGQRCEAEDIRTVVGCGDSRAPVSSGAELEAPFCSGWRFREMFDDEVQSQERKTLEKTKIDRAEKCLDGRAKQNLVHVFDPILQVGDGMHIVELMGHHMYVRVRMGAVVG